MTDKLFALWHHDRTMLGGTVVRIDDSGLATIEEYGGYRFRPAIILPEQRGKVVLAEFKALDNGRRAAQKKLDAEWEAKTKELMKKHGVKP